MNEKTGLAVGGVFTFEHVRNGEVIDSWEDKNLVVNEGLNYLLRSSLNNGTQEPSWYIGIFEGNYTPVATDVASNIAASATESTAYTESARPLWDNSEPSGQQITNSATKATFSINATKSIYGAFLISDNTKGGTIGTLFAASRFSTKRDVQATDQLLVTYTVSATSGS